MKTFIVIATFVSLLPIAAVSGVVAYTLVRWQLMKKCEEDNYSVDIISEMNYIDYAKGEKING
jgi:hypothetical protein